MTSKETHRSIEEFHSLDLETQKKKLHSMVAVFAHAAPVWQEVLEVVETNPNIDKEFTENIYNSIMEYSDETEHNNKIKAQQAITNAAQYVNNIKKKESAERAQEEKELEWMLDAIEHL